MARYTELNTQYTLSADFNSDTWDVTSLKEGSLQFDWSAADAVDGVITVQCSNDDINWDSADTPAPVVLIDAPSGTKVIAFRQFPFRYVRFQFAAGSNTAGTLLVRSFGTDKNLGYK